MKLKLNSIITFFFILILIYPSVYFIVAKKVNQRNQSLITTKYSLIGFFKLKNYDGLDLIANNKVTNINDKFFKEKRVNLLVPISVVDVKNYKVIFDLKNLEKDKFEIGKIPENAIIKREELSLSLDNYLILNFDFKIIYPIIRDFFSNFANSFDQIDIYNKCKNFDLKLKNFLNLSHSLFQYSLDITDENLYNSETSDEEKIQIFQNCLEILVKKKSLIIVNFFENYLSLQENVYSKNFDLFIQNNSELFSNRNKIKIFKDDIDEIKKELIRGLKATNLELRYIDPINIVTIEKFQKKNNKFVISFILSFLFSLLLFYFLFFFKKKFKFLNKIF